MPSLGSGESRGEEGNQSLLHQSKVWVTEWDDPTWCSEGGPSLKGASEQAPRALSPDQLSLSLAANGIRVLLV